MKKYKILMIVALFVGAIAMPACSDDFLTSTSTEKGAAGEVPSENTLLSYLGSAYQILLFDSYAANNYNSIPLMSDLRSDDLYKGGGDASDQHGLYLLSLFTSTPDETVEGLWSIYYSGIARCNNVIIACGQVADVDAGKLARYKAEAHFLRAYYTHLLWKFYGNVPYFTEPLAKPYVAKQYKADEIYAFIMADLEIACAADVLPMSVEGAALGRASLAAALMLKARVVMYQKDPARYAEITNDMAAIIKSGKFDLFPDFDAMWNDENEFCKESIFESNQLPEGKVWATGWQGYGTNLPAFIAPSGLKDPSGVFKDGWGFGVVRESALDLYEPGDQRLKGSINDWRTTGSYSERFQNTGLFMRKYAARVGYNPPPGDQDLNYCNNLRIFRYAETLLNYAELVVMHNQTEAGVSAQECLDQIRRRAFDGDKPIPATVDGIKAERHREFLGEGMRFWDLVRWGDAAKELTENIPKFSERTFTEQKKYLPIPQSEIDKTKGTEYELQQNQW